MSNPKNGDYLIVSDGKIVMYLNHDHADAIDRLNKYYSSNKSIKPEAYLVQVQAMLHYPPPTIKTLAHEVIV
jgi:hypothetical protein